VTLLSGPAADSFGVPARNGATYVIDQLKKGSAPSPYEKVGFGGLKVEPIIIDENGGATNRSRNCATFISATMSMSCSAISAPRLSRGGSYRRRTEKMLVLIDCGTARLANFPKCAIARRCC
jgi:branched-chain amino acid transport system substrate-binding protein